MSKNDKNQNNLNQRKLGQTTTSRFSVQTIVYIGLFAAIISVCALIAIPTPWGVSFTLHTFAVALTAFCLGKWKGALTTFIYVMIGLVGVPVYSGFTAGPAKLFGITGGYIWSFIIMTFICGIGIETKKKWSTVLFSILGLLVCYICGMLQFMLITKMGFIASLMATIVPYVAKDVVSILAAYGLAIPIRKVMKLEQYQNKTEMSN